MRNHRLMGSLVCFGAFVAVASALQAQDTSPRLISAQMAEVNSYVYPRIALLQQSGERLVVDAILISMTETGPVDGEWIPIASDFVFNVPLSKQSSRICVEITNAEVGVRKLSLMKLIKPVNRVTARIDFPSDIQAGTIMVAYPTDASGDDPQRACASGENWIYPVRKQVTKGENPGTILQLRVNTGGEDAKVAQVSPSGIVFGGSQTCERSTDVAGLFDRICRLALDDIRPDTKIQIVVAQRNSGSLKRHFNLAVGSE